MEQPVLTALLPTTQAMISVVPALSKAILSLIQESVKSSAEMGSSSPLITSVTTGIQMMETDAAAPVSLRAAICVNGAPPLPLMSAPKFTIFEFKLSLSTKTHFWSLFLSTNRSSSQVSPLHSQASPLISSHSPLLPSLQKTS